MIWLSKFFPSLASRDRPEFESLSWGSVWVWVFGLGLAGFFLALRPSPPLRRMALAAVAGFVGMVLESVLILYYQMKVGVLYQDIGVLLMSFMAGLALGAQAMGKVTAGEGAPKRKLRLWVLALLLGFCLLAGGLSLLMWRGYETDLAETAMLLGSIGFVVAAVFACASRYEVADQEKAVAPIYAADLLGGCAGALLAGVLLVPLAGLLTAVLCTVWVAALAMLLI